MTTSLKPGGDAGVDRTDRFRMIEKPPAPAAMPVDRVVEAELHLSNSRTYYQYRDVSGVATPGVC